MAMQVPMRAGAYSDSRLLLSYPLHPSPMLPIRQACVLLLLSLPCLNQPSAPSTLQLSGGPLTRHSRVSTFQALLLPLPWLGAWLDVGVVGGWLFPPCCYVG